MRESKSMCRSAPSVVMFTTVPSITSGGKNRSGSWLEIATRGYVIETGQVKLQGSAEELRSDPKIRSAYLGL